MNYPININGIDVDAVYSEENIREVFLPLLRRLTAMQREKGRRILVMLAAPPAAGKSTLASFLSHLSQTTPDLTPVTVIGMDGFHRYQDHLLSHYTIRDGKEIPLVKIKGAPITFDLDRFTAFVARAASGEVMGWPQYDRMLHNPVEDAIRVEGDIVLLEGNYLLLDCPGWRELHKYADLTIRITAEESSLRRRLIDRKCASGTPYDEAVEFVEFSDLANARLCLQHTLPADLTLRLMEDDSYMTV